MRLPIAVVALLTLLHTGVAMAQTPLERGKYLMDTVVACGNCHTPQGPDGPVAGREMAGGTPFNEGFGLAFAPNITPDRETGIGGWSDAQIIAAIREGKRPDGSIIGPPTPIALYRAMSDGRCESHRGVPAADQADRQQGGEVAVQGAAAACLWSPRRVRLRTLSQ
jgi:hypothetical protein